MLTFYAGNYYKKFRKTKHSRRPRKVLIVFEIGKNCHSSGNENVTVHTESKYFFLIHLKNWGWLIIVHKVCGLEIAKLWRFVFLFLNTYSVVDRLLVLGASSHNGYPWQKLQALKKSQLFIKFTSVCLSNLKFVEDIVIYSNDSKLTLVIVKKYCCFESCKKS